MGYKNEEFKRLDNKVRYLQDSINFNGIRLSEKDKRKLTEKEVSENKVNGRLLTVAEKVQGRLLVSRPLTAQELTDKRKELALLQPKRDELAEKLEEEKKEKKAAKKEKKAAKQQKPFSQKKVMKAAKESEDSSDTSDYEMEAAASNMAAPSSSKEGTSDKGKDVVSEDEVEAAAPNMAAPSSSKEGTSDKVEAATSDEVEAAASGKVEAAAHNMAAPPPFLEDDTIVVRKRKRNRNASNMAAPSSSKEGTSDKVEAATSDEVEAAASGKVEVGVEVAPTSYTASDKPVETVLTPPPKKRSHSVAASDMSTRAPSSHGDTPSCKRARTDMSDAGLENSDDESTREATSSGTQHALAVPAEEPEILVALKAELENKEKEREQLETKHEKTVSKLTKVQKNLETWKKEKSGAEICNKRRTKDKSSSSQATIKQNTEKINKLTPDIIKAEVDEKALKKKRDQLKKQLDAKEKECQEVQNTLVREQAEAAAAESNSDMDDSDDNEEVSTAREIFALFGKDEVKATTFYSTIKANTRVSEYLHITDALEGNVVKQDNRSRAKVERLFQALCDKSGLQKSFVLEAFQDFDFSKWAEEFKIELDKKEAKAD